jgi:hypothetical protein
MPMPGMAAPGQQPQRDKKQQPEKVWTEGKISKKNLDFKAKTWPTMCQIHGLCARGRMPF